MHLQSSILPSGLQVDLSITSLIWQNTSSQTQSHDAPSPKGRQCEAHVSKIAIGLLRQMRQGSPSLF